VIKKTVGAGGNDVPKKDARKINGVAVFRAL
jgi:hypothetical protein